MARLARQRARLASISPLDRGAGFLFISSMSRTNRFPAGAAAPAVAAILLFLTLLGCQAVPPPDAKEAAAPQPAGPEADRLPLDPAVSTGTLANGLTYYVRSNGHPEKRAELRLVVNAGSVLEEDGQQGLAHFVEHMAFNGTEHFRKHEIVDFLESAGMRFGPEVNAYTNFDETVYMLQVPTDQPAVVDRALLVLQDWAAGVLFEPEEVERERAVVIEEWRLGRGADARIRDRQFPVLFRGSRYAARRPIGSVEVLRAATAADLKRFYRRWYRPELMAVAAVGDFDSAQMVERIRRHFGALSSPGGPVRRPHYRVPPHRQTLYAPATDPEATATRVSLYLKREARPTVTVSDYRRDLVELMYHGMLSERLEELTHTADSPLLSAASFSYRPVRPEEVSVLAARVRPGKVQGALEALLVESERVRRFGFTPGELARQKEALLSRMERLYQERDKEESERLVRQYVDNFLEGEPIPSLQYEHNLVGRLVPEVSLEEVNRQAAGALRRENRVVLVSAPQELAASVPPRFQVLNLFGAVRGRDLAPYQDRTVGEPLIPAELPGGAVVERSQIPELGLIQWRLANGVRVVLKPTEFKNDQVLMGAVSPGGTSLVPDREYVSAMLAAAVVKESGVGGFDAAALRKKLAGTEVEVTPWIGELFEGLRGEARPADLETMFRLVYLYFTAPRRDPGAFEAYRQRLLAFARNRQASPEAAFWDTLESLLSRGDYRSRPWTEEVVNELKLEEALRIYRERFADAADFTFFLVGSFDPQRIEPLAVEYLGSLPAAGASERFRDLGVDPPEGVVRQKVAKGLEPKSRVELVFAGPFDWSLDSRFTLQALAEVMDIQLREVVREQAGGTYNVGVEATAQEYPDQEYQVRIGFGCAPEQEEPLTALVMQSIERLREQGPQAEHVAKVREILRRERETELETNEFWLERLQFVAVHGLDPRVILDYDSRLAALDGAALREMARRTLLPDRYVQVVLVPEGAP